MAVHAFGLTQVRIVNSDGDEYNPAGNSRAYRVVFPEATSGETFAFTFPMALSASVTILTGELQTLFRRRYRRDREFVKLSNYHFTLHITRTSGVLPDIRVYKPRRGYKRILEVLL